MTLSYFSDTLVLIKGGGDLATGAAWRLHRCGFPVVMTELARPLAVRRAVAFAQAVFDGEHTVEGVTARLTALEDVPGVLAAHEIPVLVDTNTDCLRAIAPVVLVDARVAKRNIDTSIHDAPLVLALGPGYTAGVDCHAVIETNRSHNLGRVLWQGRAEADTGDPGPLPGVLNDSSRVLRAGVSGRFISFARIGDRLPAGETIGVIRRPGGEEAPVLAPFTGVVRGLIHESTPVNTGMKIGDMDPRIQAEHAFTISDKSLAIGGGVLEAILTWVRENK
ncbi:MAG: EF2563 family selenium-dependent molybdenum hydroxylase system protein [Chloroflexi bacterium]|nr:MAG: EF2563 family selenium-dependent molybdenum hydroxylase system protein [Chloroflexota bacterium]